MGPSAPHTRRFGRPLLVGLLCLLVPIVPFAVIGELPGERWLLAAEQTALQFGATGAGLLALDVVLPVPSSLVGALLGGRLGLLAGFCWAFAGLLLGHVIGYWLGRLAPARFATELPKRPTLVAVFLSRPVPVAAEAMAVWSGVERVPFLAYFSACAAGDALYASALAANGATLLPKGLAGPGLVVPLLLPVLGWLAWKRIASRSD